MIPCDCRRCDGTGELECECPACHRSEYDACVYAATDGVFDCRSCNGTGQEQHLIYANVYAVTRYYGGPEEGGWWFNAGEPLACHRVAPHCDPGIVRALLTAQWADHAEGNIYESTGGVEIHVRFQSHFAVAWPERRPHYE